MALHAWHGPGDPSVYGTLEIDVEQARELVSDLREETGARVTITHLVGRALALAIAERPEVNSIVRFGSLYRRDTIDIFFQVAFDGGEDLNGAKVAAADRKSVVEIARELDDAARAVRERRAAAVKTATRFKQLPSALTGIALRATSFATYDLGLDLSSLGVPYDAFGSAMITNVGSFGLSTGHAPLVPFSRCPIVVLVGEIRERPAVRDGVVVPRPILPLGITFDHRLLDGYQASKMAARFTELLENPRSLRP
jgi:pyruvate/2-oxoglutarate dehydrogenase complex dihydrolipoamide acyltransferase (E2) component